MTRWNPLFSDIPVESMIYVRQSDYYDAIAQSSRDGQSTVFIEFMLKTIFEKIKETGGVTDQDSDQVTDQVKGLLASFEAALGKAFSASELMAAVGLSHRPTFRQNYLSPALADGLIEMTIPDKPNSRNQKYRLTPKGKNCLQVSGYGE